MRKHNFPPYYSSSLVRSKTPLFAAFDFETVGLGGDLLLASWAVIDENGSISSGLIDGLSDQILAQLLNIMWQYPKHSWYAHNAQYEWRYMMRYFRDCTIKPEIFMRNKTDIYMIQLRDGKKRLRMLDSMAVWNGSLKTLLDVYASDLPKLSIDVAHFDTLNPEHRAYAERDSIGLAVAMKNLNQMLKDSYGVDVRVTAASTAIAAWESQLGEKYFMNETREDYIRSAYFGGAVFLTRSDIVEGAVTYDINSSYPYQMRKHDVPYGNIYQTFNYHPDKLGIYTVTVDTLKCDFPCLPMRLENNSIIWPLGRFQTTITNIELEFAIQHGYELLEIHDGVIFERSINPFVSFVDKCETIRIGFKGKPQESLAKLIQNSLYGKFGSRRERTIMFVPESNADIVDAEPWDDEQYYWTRTEHQDLRCMPAWAVFITARARLHLFKAAFDVGIDKVIYGDTDSLTITSRSDRIDTGDRYGQFKLEKEWKLFRATAPKTYSGILAVTYKTKRAGTLTGAAKGMPTKAMGNDQWRGLLEGDRISAEYLSLSSLRVSLRTGELDARLLRRRSSLLENSNGWRQDGTAIRPRLLR